MRKSLILLLLSIALAWDASAQYYVTGQDPASLRWDQIRTEHFRVIYPRDFTSMAAKYASLLEESYGKVAGLYPGVNVRIPVIIHNYSMESNGYVTWAPRRMELYPLPGQTNLPDDPAKLLVIHESTHVAQLGSLNRGVTKFLSLLFGEQITGLNALMIPDWAFEGDAVYAETLFSGTGRGRSNAFIQKARALSLSEGGIYGYDKLLSGSYRDFTPDHYVFGYLMMNTIRGESSDAWPEAMDGAGRMKIFNPVNASLKKNIGITKQSLYDSTFSRSERLWLGSEKETAAVRQEYMTGTKKSDYVSYYMPHATPGGKIISIRTSLSRPAAFVITDPADRSEKTITTTGYIYPYIFSYSSGTVVWSEIHPDPRWENRQYSVIKKMNPEEGTVTSLTFRTRLEAPSLSPDGKLIAAISTTPDMSCSLAFIDSNTGMTVMEIAPPDSLILQRPAWTSDGKGVTVVTLCPSGEGIRTYYPTGKRWVVNREESATDIIQAGLHGDTLLWLAQGDGSDNIYRTTADGRTVRLSSSRFGISGFTISPSGSILASDCTADGFAVTGVNPSVIYPASLTSESLIAVSGAEKADTADRTSSVTLPEPVPYRRAGHLFNFHSWFPFYADIDEIQSDPTAINPGLTLLSQNHLSTLITTVGYEYADGFHKLHSSIQWRGWYPVIEGDISYGGEQVITKPSGITTEPADLSPGMNLNLNVSLPLYFPYGKFRQTFMPAIYISYKNNYTYIREDNAFDEDLVNLTYRLYFANTFRTAYRDINPRWGQVIDLRLINAPWDRDIYGSLRYARGILFFPGLVRNHSLVLRAGYENQAPSKKLLYSNRNPYPRGSKEYVSEEMVSFSADYTLPIFYPDLSAGSLFYLKRIRGSLFADGARGTGILDFSDNSYNSGTQSFSSYGGELLADFYLLRFPFEISAGVNGGYVASEGKPFVSAVFSVNIYGTTLGRKF